MPVVSRIETSMINEDRDDEVIKMSVKTRKLRTKTKFTSKYNATSEWITSRICDNIFCYLPSETRCHE